MDHQPDETVVTPLDLDEVIASPQRAQLLPGRLHLPLDHRDADRCLVEAIPLLRSFVVLESHGNRTLQQMEHLGDLPLLDPIDRAIRLHRPDAAADVHAYRVGNHRISQGHDPTDGHSVSNMAVGHQGDMVEGAGVIAQVDGLGKGLLLEFVTPALYNQAVVLSVNRLHESSPFVVFHLLPDRVLATGSLITRCAPTAFSFQAISASPYFKLECTCNQTHRQALIRDVSAILSNHLSNLTLQQIVLQ